MFEILFNIAATLSDERTTIIDDIMIVASDASGETLDWPQDLATEINEISPKNLWMECEGDWAKYSAYYELPDGTTALLEWRTY